MHDVRITLRETFTKACELIRREKEIAYESILLVGQLKERNAPINLGLTEPEYLRRLGLSKDMYYKRWQACRVIRRFPQFDEMLRRGETFIAQLAMVAPKLTEANAMVMADGIRGKSKREVALFLSTIHDDGTRREAKPTLTITLELDEDEWTLLSRVQDILSSRGENRNEKDVIMKALEFMAERKDPMRRAERAAERAEQKTTATTEEDKTTSGTVPGQCHSDERRLGSFAPGRKPIPAAVRHRVWLRDGGQCTYMSQFGVRCPERRMLEIDHRVPVARGGGHDANNLRLLCRYHNQGMADQVFGSQWMADKRSMRMPRS